MVAFQHSTVKVFTQFACTVEKQKWQSGKHSVFHTLVISKLQHSQVTTSHSKCSLHHIRLLAGYFMKPTSFSFSQFCVKLTRLKQYIFSPICTSQTYPEDLFIYFLWIVLNYKAATEKRGKRRGKGEGRGRGEEEFQYGKRGEGSKVSVWKKIYFSTVK